MDSDYEENKKQAGESSDEESKLLIKILSSKSAEAISAPLPMDIICGRGKSISHAGNQRLRELVLAKKDAYQKAQRRDDKTRITLELVEELRRGSRYVIITRSMFYTHRDRNTSTACRLNRHINLTALTSYIVVN